VIDSKKIFCNIEILKEKSIYLKTCWCQKFINLYFEKNTFNYYTKVVVPCEFQSRQRRIYFLHIPTFGKNMILDTTGLTRILFPRFGERLERNIGLAYIRVASTLKETFFM
jgi:hypothetical protein